MFGCDGWPRRPGFDARFGALWRRYAYRVADSTELLDPLTRAQCSPGVASSTST